MNTSCLGCKWLFTRDDGYSNYTVTDTSAHCVLCKNPNLPTEIPDEVREYHYAAGGTEYRWMSPDNDRWFATKNSRCDNYQHIGDAAHHHIDCDGEDIMTEEAAREHMLRTADTMPLLIAQYFKETP